MIVVCMSLHVGTGLLVRGSPVASLIPNALCVHFAHRSLYVYLSSPQQRLVYFLNIYHESVDYQGGYPWINWHVVVAISCSPVSLVHGTLWGK